MEEKKEVLLKQNKTKKKFFLIQINFFSYHSANIHSIILQSIHTIHLFLCRLFCCTKPILTKIPKMNAKHSFLRNEILLYLSKM